MSIKRGLVAVLSAGTLIAGAMTTTSTAHAAGAQVVTNYGFQTAAYGSWVKTGPVGVTSGKTAWSIIGCTRLTGLAKQVAVVGGPTIAGALNVGAVTSNSQTYKNGDIVGTRSTNSVAQVTLGDPNGVNIHISGLTTRANAWADSNGHLHARPGFDSVSIGASTGTPLDDVLNQVDAGIGDLFDAITGPLNAQIDGVADDKIVIPGLGEIKLGYTATIKKANFAKAVATALEVTLYTPDSNTVVRIGQSEARITRDLPAGVFHGFAYPLDASLLQDAVLLRARPVGHPMPCRGTNGHVLEDGVAFGDVLNAGAVGTGVVTSRVYGIQHDDGSAKGWTEGRVASVNIGDGAIVITGIVGRANVRQNTRGEVFKNALGSTIGSLTINGETQAIPDPGQTIEVPGVARITFMEKIRTRRGIQVTAVKIELLMDTPLNSIVRLGWAKAAITKV